MLEDLKKLINSYKEKTQGFLDIEKQNFLSSRQSFVSPAQKESSPEIIVICNQKGGCAKTTTAINLSASLAKKDHNVLLLDLDPQAHASLGLGADVENLNHTLYDVLINNVELDKVIIPTSIDKLFLAPTNHLLSGAQLELANLVARESILKINFNKLFLNRRFDFCIIDTSPTLNLVTLNALVAATSVLIPLQTHYYSLEGMKELFSTIEVVRDRLNPSLRILGLLPTIFDGRIKANNEMLSEIREYFGNLVLKTVIHNNSKILEATRYKKSVINYAPGSKGAQNYLSLAEELDYILKENNASKIS